MTVITEFFSVESEQIILGTLLYDPESMDMAHAIRPEDFVVEENRLIFELLLRDMNFGRSPSSTTLAPLLADMQVGQITGKEYLLKLARSKNRDALASCIHGVKQMAARRQLSGIGSLLVEQAAETAIDPSQLATDAMYHLNEASATALVRRAEAEMIGQSAEKLVDALDGTGDESVIPTGLTTLDTEIGGWAKGEVTIIAGRPGMGKSAILMALARRAAIKGHALLLFSLEMPKRAVVARMLSDAVYTANAGLRVPYSRILRKEVTPDERDRLRAILDVFHGYDIKVDDQPGLTMVEIQARAWKYSEELRKRGKRLAVVMVDHIGKIKASDRYAGNVVHETAEKSDALMALAKTMDVAVVAAHQLNRGVEHREEKRPVMSDLRDTGNIEQDAHTIIFPYRAAYYLERVKCDDPEAEVMRMVDLEAVKHKIELILAKSRNGKTGNWNFFVDMENNVLDDVANPNRLTNV